MVEQQEDLRSIPHRPFHTKRPHKKSRAGCLNCKRRKVKCNEARPVCNNCALRNGDCVYPEATSAARTRSTSAGPTSRTEIGSFSSSSSPSSFPNEASDGTITVVREPLFIPAPVRDATDLKLMWYYTTNTFASFLTVRNAREQRLDDILKITIPAYAFQSPFLMDTLLSLSAIQLQLDPAPGQAIEVEPSRVYQYRARAYEGYRHAVEEARPETYPALMACSLLLIGLASQTFREPDCKDLFILDWMVLWRGIGVVFDLVKAKGLLQSGIAELFCRPPIDLDQAALHIPNSLLFMVSSTIASSAAALSMPADYAQVGLDEYDLETDAEISSRDTYYAALRYLGSLYQELRNGFGPRLNLRAITWFTYLPRHFIELATARRPRALLIMAHYLMFLKLVRGTWWVDGIADHEIPGIARLFQRLDRRIRDWSAPYMTGPLAVVQASSPTEVARIILEDPTWIPPPTSPNQQQLLEPPPIILSPDGDVEDYKGPFMVDNNGKLTRYDPESGSFVAVESGRPQSEGSPSSVQHQTSPSDGIASPSPSSDAASTMVNGPGADLEDVQMDKLHLDTALRYGSMNIVLGNLRDEDPQDPWL